MEQKTSDHLNRGLIVGRKHLCLYHGDMEEYAGVHNIERSMTQNETEVGEMLGISHIPLTEAEMFIDNV